MLSTDQTISVYSVLPPCHLAESFSGLTGSGKERLAELSATVEFPKGSVIFKRGAEPASVWLLTGGKAKLSYRQGWEGTEASKTLGPGEVCGLTETLAGIPYEASLQAITPCSLKNLTYENLNRFLRDEPAFCADLLGFLARDYYQGYLKLLSVS